MQGNCPRCQTPLELPTSGAYECERCHTRFEVAVGAVAPPTTVAAPQVFQGGLQSPAVTTPAASPSGWPQQEPALDIDAPCAGHPANPASRVCERCGDFMCRLCTTQVEGRAYCPKCFDLLYNRGALQFTQRQFALPGITLALGITSIAAFIVCFVVFGLVLAIPAGIAGLATGLRANKCYQERPELSGRQMTTVGMWLSGVGLLLGLVNCGFWVWVMMNNK